MTYNAIVKSDGLNVRAAATGNARVVLQIAKGDLVEVRDHDLRGNWAKVRVLRTRTGIGVGTIGWVFDRDLEADKPPKPDVPKSRPKDRNDIPLPETQPLLNPAIITWLCWIVGIGSACALVWLFW